MDNFLQIVFWIFLFKWQNVVPDNVVVNGSMDQVSKIMQYVLLNNLFGKLSVQTTYLWLGIIFGVQILPIIDPRIFSAHGLAYEFQPTSGNVCLTLLDLRVPCAIYNKSANPMNGDEAAECVKGKRQLGQSNEL